MKKPKFSIIIPIFNAKKYIGRCIRSVLSQSYKEFELILVDDGSTDGSGAICLDYCKSDERVKFFSQDNQGAGVARNLGLQKAKGEFICFVDADDYVVSTMLETLEKNIDLSTDVLLFGYYRDSERCSEKIGIPQADSQTLKIWLTNDKILNFLWNKCFRASLFNIHCKFENRFAEDYYVLPTLLWDSGANLKVLDNFLYHYQVLNSASTTHTMNSRKFFQCWEAFKKNQLLLDSIGESTIPLNEYSVIVDKCFELGRISYVLSLLDHMIDDGERDIIRSYFKTQFIKYLRSRDLRKILWSFVIGLNLKMVCTYWGRRRGYNDAYRIY